LDRSNLFGVSLRALGIRVKKGKYERTSPILYKDRRYGIMKERPPLLDEDRSL
jgi:hypothetical protein